MLRLRPFELERPRSVAEAVSCLVGAAMPIAGGTDLLPKLKRYQFDPDRLVSLQGIEELRALSVSEAGVSIGALVRLRELELHPAIAAWPVLQQSVAAIATPTLRSMATVGGNLCQDTRCRYYDRSQHWREAAGFCTKKDGAICRVAPSSPRCHATLCSDLAPALIVLDARVQLVGQKQRSVALAELYKDDGIRNLNLQGELLTSVEFSLRPRYSRYLKLRLREGFDFPELGVAVSIDGKGSALGAGGDEWDEPLHSELAGRVRRVRIGPIGRAHPRRRQADGHAVVSSGLSQGDCQSVCASVLRRIHAAAMNPSFIPHVLRLQCGFVATILRTTGHSYKPEGHRAVYEADGIRPVHGNLGSLCVDQELLRQGGLAIAAQRPRQLQIDTSKPSDIYAGHGVHCGGRIELLIEPVLQPHYPVYERLSRHCAAGDRIFLEHEIESGDLSLSRGLPSTLPGVYVEEFPPLPQLFLVGATPLAERLVRILDDLPLRSTILDWRSAHLSALSPAQRVLLLESEYPFAPGDAVLVLSHDFRRDRQALRRAIETSCSYVGFLSSKSRRDRMYGELRDGGVSDADLARIRCPVGLPIGGRSDAEIAISIAAQLVQEFLCP